MADTSSVLEIILRAKDEATSKLKSMAQQAKSLSVGFVAVGGAVTGALGLAVKAAAEAEVQMAKVNATLKAMGKDTPAVRDAIQKAADATLQLGFDNEEAAVSIAKLYQRTNDLTQATKLNALAMDLSRAKNISLEQASTLVGQVLAGNGKILKQYGIDIKETASPMEALAELQTRVAGQAQAYSETFQGQMDIFKAKTGEIVETIGAQLLPILNDLLAKIQPIIDKIIAWTQAHPELTKNIVLITAALGALLLVVGTLGLALTPLAAGIAFLASPIGIVVAAITLALIPVIMLLMEHWQTLKEGAIQAWTNIGETINAYIQAITATFKGWLAWMELFWKRFKDGFKEMIDSVIGFFKPLFDTIEKIKNAISGVVDSVKSGVSNAVKKISGKKALGGSVMSGSTYLVGEQGPELFTPFQSGSITPNGALAGGGGIVININGGTYLSESVAREIGDKIIEQFKRTVRI